MKKLFTKKAAVASMIALLLFVNFSFATTSSTKFGASKAVATVNLAKISTTSSQKSTPTVLAVAAVVEAAAAVVVAVAAVVVAVHETEGFAAPKSATSAEVSLSNLD